MATKSIYKDVRIRDRASAQKLAKALKEAEEKAPVAPPAIYKKVRTVTDPDSIRSIFEQE